MTTQLYRHKAYLEKICPFVNDTGIIKVITGIRRCGESCLMKTAAEKNYCTWRSSKKYRLHRPKEIWSEENQGTRPT